MDVLPEVPRVRATDVGVGKCGDEIELYFSWDNGDEASGEIEITFDLSSADWRFIAEALTSMDADFPLPEAKQ